jgi:hypothetical protein
MKANSSLLKGRTPFRQHKALHSSKQKLLKEVLASRASFSISKQESVVCFLLESTAA